MSPIENGGEITALLVAARGGDRSAYDRIFALVYDESDAGIAALRSAVAVALSPELVNDGETTAPSKRIISQFPQYSGQKTTVGVELAHCVGIDTTRSLCAHFDRWLKVLESLGSPPGVPPEPHAG